jgi:hypothetical protein
MPVLFRSPATKTAAIRSGPKVPLISMRTRILGWLPPHATKALGGQNGCHGSKCDRVSRCRRLAWPPLRPGTKCSPTRPASTCSRGNQSGLCRPKDHTAISCAAASHVGFKNVLEREDRHASPSRKQFPAKPRLGSCAQSKYLGAGSTRLFHPQSQQCGRPLSAWTRRTA